jgi:hypothetical protein
MDKPKTPLAASPVDGDAQLLEDLAILCDGPSIELKLGFDGGLIAMRSNEKLVYQNSAETRWIRQGGTARARLLATWIHEAAEKYRTILAERLGAKKKGVA